MSEHLLLLWGAPAALEGARERIAAGATYAQTRLLIVADQLEMEHAARTHRSQEVVPACEMSEPQGGVQMYYFLSPDQQAHAFVEQFIGEHPEIDATLFAFPGDEPGLRRVWRDGQESVNRSYTASLGTLLLDAVGVQLSN